MLHKHICPTGCLIEKQLWVFSTHFIEYMQDEQWKNINLPFGAVFLPFQFVFPINAGEILIFGGMEGNEKNTEVKIYNTIENKLNNYGMILPQGLCN